MNKDANRITIAFDLPPNLGRGYFVSGIGVKRPHIAAGLGLADDFNWFVHGYSWLGSLNNQTGIIALTLAPEIEENAHVTVVCLIRHVLAYPGLQLRIRLLLLARQMLFFSKAESTE